MKKTYILPSLRIVGFGRDICETLLIGSGNTESTSGNGNDLVKEDFSAGRGGRQDYNVWDDNWSN